MRPNRSFLLLCAIAIQSLAHPGFCATFVGPRIEKFGRNPDVGTYGAVVAADAAGIYAYTRSGETLRRYDQNGELLAATTYDMPVGGKLFWLGDGLFLHHRQEGGPVIQLVSPEGRRGQPQLLMQAATISRVTRVGSRALILVNAEVGGKLQANLLVMDLATQNLSLLIAASERWYDFLADTNGIIALRPVPGVTQIGLRRYSTPVSCFKICQSLRQQGADS